MDPERDDLRMTGAELRVTMRWLGLDQASLGVLLGVQDRTVRRWVAGTHPIPDGVREQLDHVQAAAAAAVAEVVAAAKEATNPVVGIPRTTQDMWKERPATDPYPVGWWEQVVARSIVEVPALRATYSSQELPAPKS